jgi:hypothetical protein
MTDQACPQIDKVYDWLTDRLTGPEKSAFEQHLAGCEACRAEVAALEEALGHLAAWPQPRLSPGFSQEVLARLDSPRPGLASRLSQWFAWRPWPMVAGALVAAGLVVAVIGFFPGILSDPALRREGRMSSTGLTVRRAAPVTAAGMKKSARDDRIQPSVPARTEKKVAPAPPPPAPAPPAKPAPARLVKPAPPPPAPAPESAVRPAPHKVRSGEAARKKKSTGPKLKIAARPRSVAPRPPVADRSRSDTRSGPGATVTPSQRRFQQYSVRPRQSFLYRQQARRTVRRRSAGPQTTGAVRPAPAGRTTTRKAAVASLQERRRLPRNLSMVLSLVDRYGGRVRKPYRKTSRGLILEVTVPIANRRVFLTRLGGLKGQGVTRLGTDLTPIRVLVSKYPRTDPASPAR